MNVNSRGYLSARSVGWSLVGLCTFALSVSGCGGKRSSVSEISDAERARIPGIIAFVSERGANKDVWLVTPTGQKTQLTGGAEDEYPALAMPSGAALLVVATRDDDGVHKEQLRLVATAGGATRTILPLHAPRGRSRNPSVAPDGSWLVAESDARGFSDLVRMADGAEPVYLTSAPQGSFEPSVSPDGKRIAFASSRSGDPEIYVMDADGSAASVRRLTTVPQEDWAPSWSPDGQWIAFLSNRERRNRVFLIRPNGTGTHPLSAGATTGDEREPAWSPDGSRVAFVGRQTDGETRIWVAAVRGGEAVALTAGKSRDDQPVWSPDGTYLAYVSEPPGGEADLYLMRADGSGITRLTRTPGADWLPRWFTVDSASR